VADLARSAHPGWLGNCTFRTDSEACHGVRASHGDRVILPDIGSCVFCFTLVDGRAVVEPLRAVSALFAEWS
jgi:hypothetical protein